MPDILHTMTIILPNSALPWSRVNDHKKKRWSLAAKPAGERGNQCLFSQHSLRLATRIYRLYATRTFHRDVYKRQLMNKDYLIY